MFYTESLTKKNYLIIFSLVDINFCRQNFKIENSYCFNLHHACEDKIFALLWLADFFGVIFFENRENRNIA